MASQIYWALKFKRPVIANFGVNRKSRFFTEVDNEELTPEFLEGYAKRWMELNGYREGAISVYIDEAQIIYNAREWNESNRKSWIRFYSQHRKLSMNIYLVAQFDQMIDKQIRALVEYEVKHRKVNNYGIFGTVVSALTLGKPLVCAVTYWYGMKQRLSSEFFLGTKKLYRLYDTTKIFDE